MPFDFSEYETKPDLSLDGLIAWLERQPPETRYSYCDSTDCLLTRFGRAQGECRDADVFGGCDDEWDATAFNDVAEDMPWTYGAALERAKQLRGA